jgi:hypothetical protein
LCVILISPLHFFCPICHTLIQSNDQHHSLTVQIPPLSTVQFCSSPCYYRCLQTKYLPQHLF